MTAALLDLERDLLHRADRACVLDEVRETKGLEPAAGLAPSPFLASSSASAGEPDDAPVGDVSRGLGTDGISASGPSPVGALTSSKLRSIVSAARQSRGPHRVRWENRERRAWDELARRGQAA